jgi:2-desacetyl-2-hydroxyethyl bacteriochlorophyllide A dehydrogenase
VRAALISSGGDVTVETIDDPTPEIGEVVVAVASCGICGTDLHIARGEIAPSFPVVPGHEFAGEIVALGSAVRDLRVGERVVVDPSLYCYECYQCRRGRNNLCERYGAIGISVQGGAADFVAVPSANCLRLPDYVRLEDAALIEPLSCAIRGFDVLREQLGSTVLIYGAGTMGLMMLQLAKLVGASSVYIVDPNKERLKTAELLGTTASATSAEGIEMARGWDVVIDASGNVGAIQDGIGRVGPGGTFLQFGVADGEARVAIDPYRIYNKEITIAGSMAVLNSFQRASDLFANGVIDAEIFISDRLPLEEFPRALRQFANGSGRKIQVRPQESLTSK